MLGPPPEALDEHGRPIAVANGASAVLPASTGDGGGLPAAMLLGVSGITADHLDYAGGHRSSFVGDHVRSGGGDGGSSRPTNPPSSSLSSSSSPSQQRGGSEVGAFLADIGLGHLSGEFEAKGVLRLSVLAQVSDAAAAADKWGLVLTRAEDAERLDHAIGALRARFVSDYLQRKNSSTKQGARGGNADLVG